MRGSQALVVRGQDRLDKLTVTGPTDVTLVSAEHRSSFTVAPEDVGLSRSRAEGLLGSTPTDNAQQHMGCFAAGENLATGLTRWVAAAPRHTAAS